MKRKTQRAKPGFESFEETAELVFALSAWVSIISVILITVYILQGLPPILKIGVFQFILGTQWKPTAEIPQSASCP